LRDFEGKPVKPAEKAEIALDQESTGLSEEEAQALGAFVKETLGERVHEVRPSKRLVGSPAVAVESDKFMTSTMRRMMKAMNREGGPGAFDAKPDLELNPNHPMIVRLEKMRTTDAALAGKVAEQIFDNSRIAAGLLEDPREMLNRVNDLLEQLLTSRSV
jgi:TNF receptor-associated protein 1